MHSAVFSSAWSDNRRELCNGAHNVPSKVLQDIPTKEMGVNFKRHMAVPCVFKSSTWRSRAPHAQAKLQPTGFVGSDTKNNLLPTDVVVGSWQWEIHCLDCFGKVCYVFYSSVGSIFWRKQHEIKKNFRDRCAVFLWRICWTNSLFPTLGTCVSLETSATHASCNYTLCNRRTVLGPGEAFGWGCCKGAHNDRGTPNLSVRLGLETKLLKQAQF